jgi:hypothetical protein
MELKQKKPDTKTVPVAKADCRRKNLPAAVSIRLLFQIIAGKF